MQRVSHPTYTYDSTGRLTNFTPSGGTNDVVADHVMLDPRIPGPRSLLAGGLQPTILNTEKLFTPPLSMSSPPVQRYGDTASSISARQNVPGQSDIYGLTSARPFISVDRQVRNLSDTSSNVGGNPHRSMSGN